jgi:hypothetical protein
VGGPDGWLWRPHSALPTIGKCISSGYGWLEVECHRCQTQASAVQRPRDTPIWKVEAALNADHAARAAMPARAVIKLTERKEITPYKWVHPDEDDRGSGRYDLRI